jgi:probable sufE Fe/S-cluster-related protein
VWITAHFDGERVHFQGESDAIIVKGIVSLLLRVLNDQKPQDILDSDLYFIKEIGLSEHLSPTRSNGLVSMLRQMRLFAAAFASQS